MDKIEIRDLERRIIEAIEKRTDYGKQYFTSREAAKYLCLSPRILRKYTLANEIAVNRLGGKRNLLYSRKDLDAFAERYHYVSKYELEELANKH